MYWLALPALCLFAVTAALQYSGYQVWHLSGRNEDLQQVIAKLSSYDIGSRSGPKSRAFWNNRFLTQWSGTNVGSTSCGDIWGAGEGWLHLLVAPELNTIFSDILVDHGTVSRLVYISDISRLMVENENKVKADNSTFGLEVYHTYEEIWEHLYSVAAAGGQVTVDSLGVTHEGRDLLKITVSLSQVQTKPAVWIDCGIHAREWITPATCLWILDALINGYGVDDDVTSLLDQHDVHMLPVMNPDGYAYSWSSDRLWRKNRFPSESCFGVDLNRNYNATQWGGIGSSDLPCSDVYHGTAPFSEAETAAVSQQLEGLDGSETGVKASFSLHSYGGLWLFAYGWTNDLPPDSDEMYRVGNAGAAAIATLFNATYEVGPHFSTIYPATGTVVDYGYERVGLPYTYIIESRDFGYGFLLPEELIATVAEEVWRGVLAAVLAI